MGMFGRKLGDMGGNSLVDGPDMSRLDDIEGGNDTIASEQ